MKDFVGIDIGGTNLRVARVSLDGEVKKLLSQPNPVDQGPRAVVECLASMVSLVGTKQELSGIGVGCPGPLSRAQRKIFQTPNLPGFDGFPLGAALEELCGLPVVIDNDAKCAGYAEKHFGSLKETRNAILLTLGTGIGGAVFVDDKMIYGKSDGACELGHITLYPDGKKCLCGNRGCFEQYASASAIEKRAQEIEPGTNNPLLFADAAAGREWALNVLRVVARDLAIGIASLVNIFDPERVVLGGGIFVSKQNTLCDMVNESLVGRCFESSRAGMRVVPAALGERAGVVGAASLCFTSFGQDRHRS